MSYKVYLYETAKQKPIEKFIRKLQPTAQAKLAKEVELLQAYGPKLSMPHAKPIGSGLFELRVRDKQEVRVLYIYAHKSTIYLLHAFIKKQGPIPKREIETAQNRAKEIHNA